MSVQTLLFLMLILQVAIIVRVHRVERRTLEAIHRAQSQNAKWIHDSAESLRREMRQTGSSRAVEARVDSGQDSGRTGGRDGRQESGRTGDRDSDWDSHPDRAYRKPERFSSWDQSSED